jgi:hypothetical protein
VQALTTTELQALTTTQLQALTTSEIQALTTSQLVNGLTTDQIQALTTTELQALKTTQVQALTTTELQALTTTQLQALTSSEIQALTTTQVLNGLTTDQIQALTTTEVQALTTAQIANGLSTSQIQALTTTEIQALKTSQVQALTTMQIANGLSTDQIQALTTTDIQVLKTTQIQALDTTDLQALTTTQLQALTSSEVQALTTTQIANGLTTDQVAALTTTQFMALTTVQIGAFTTSQMPHLVMSSPIMLDLTGQGINTLNVTAGVQFDINGTGQAISTGWVGQGNGLLVMDANHTGNITSGSQLFGSATVMANGQTASNGYQALSALDSNGDHTITSADAIWSSLGVWVDANHDGISQTGEVKTLDQLGIVSLNLTTSANTAINNGNWEGMISSFTTSNGATHTMADVWFATAPAITPVNSLSTTLTPNQIFALSAAQAAALTTGQIAAFSTADVAVLTTSQIVSLSTDQVGALSSSGVAAMTTMQLATLTTSQVQALTSGQIGALSVAQMASLTLGTPIILDLNGNGITTQSISAGTKFDLFATGQQVNTGWVSGGDGLLVLDRNHDGIINNGSELFGSATPLANGQKAANGYAALSQMDTNGDGLITSADKGWADLNVWVDGNSDGVTQAGELHSLAALGITQLNLAATTTSNTNNGNIIGLTSGYQTTDGAQHAMADVWFVADKNGSVTPIPSVSAAVPLVPVADVVAPVAMVPVTVPFMPAVSPVPVASLTALAPAANNLSAQVSGLTQAMAAFSGLQDLGGLTTSGLSVLASSTNSPVASGTLGLAANVGGMSNVLSQFDANGQQVGGSLTAALTTSQVNIMNQSPVMALNNSVATGVVQSPLIPVANNGILVVGK